MMPTSKPEESTRGPPDLHGKTLKIVRANEFYSFTEFATC